MLEPGMSLSVGKLLARPLDRRRSDGICLAGTERMDWCANVSVWRSSLDLVAIRVPSIRRNESAVPKTKIIATMDALGIDAGRRELIVVGN
jgi:hypothetical protein